MGISKQMRPPEAQEDPDDYMEKASGTGRYHLTQAGREMRDKLEGRTTASDPAADASDTTEAAPAHPGVELTPSERAGRQVGGETTGGALSRQLTPDEREQVRARMRKGEEYADIIRSLPQHEPAGPASRDAGPQPAPVARKMPSPFKEDEDGSDEPQQTSGGSY